MLLSELRIKLVLGCICDLDMEYVLRRALYNPLNGSIFAVRRANVQRHFLKVPKYFRFSLASNIRTIFRVSHELVSSIYQHAYVPLCVCVNVCVCKREREKEKRDRQTVMHSWYVVA